MAKVLEHKYDVYGKPVQKEEPRYSNLFCNIWRGFKIKKKVM